MSRRSAAAASSSAAAEVDDESSSASALNRIYLHSFTVLNPEKGKQKDEWGTLPQGDRTGAVTLAVRYCVLKQLSGSGFITETELKEVIATEYPAVKAVKAALAEARETLLTTFGLQLLPVYSGLKEDLKYVIDESKPVGDDADDEGDDDELLPGAGLPRESGTWMLRLNTEEAAAEEDYHALTTGAVDGMTAAEKGLLAIALAFIFIQPDKCMREDVLVEQIHEVDPDAFPLSAGRGKAAADDDAVMGAAVPKWRSVLERFAKQKFLWKRAVTGDRARATGDDAGGGGARGGAAAGSKFEYALGPLARQAIGVPAILALVSQICGKDFLASVGSNARALDAMFGMEACGIENFRDRIQKGRGLGSESGSASATGAATRGGAAAGGDDDDDVAPAASSGRGGRRKR